MSHIHYNRQWQRAMDELLSNIDIENVPDLNKFTKKSTNELFSHYGRLYIRYSRIISQIEEAYDQITHPQKRSELKKLLEGIIGRFLEVREVLCLIKKTEFFDVSPLLKEMNLSLDSYTVSIPRFIVDDRAREIEENDLLFKTLTKNATTTTEQPVEEENDLMSMSIEEAILIIQVNERGRQGRLRAKERREELNNSSNDNNSEVSSKFTQETAAIQIQKIFRGFLCRKRLEQSKNEEELFIGMKAKPTDKVTFDQANAVRTRRKLLQRQYEKEYKDSLVQEKADILAKEGQEKSEKMKDEIEHWFISTKEMTGKFPQYPEEGTKKLFGRKALKDIEAENEKIEEEIISAKKTALQAKSNSNKRGGSTRKDNTNGTNDVPDVFKSHYLSTVHDSATAYTRVWEGRDESRNPAQRHDIELLRENLLPEIEEELRKSVDETLKIELENLRNSVEKGRKKRAVKKKRDRKKARGRNVDLSADRTIESLFEELVQKGIICKPKPFKLKDFLGTPNFLLEAETALFSTSHDDAKPTAGKTSKPSKPASKATKDAKGKPSDTTTSTLPPSPADIRRVLVETCILPLSSTVVREKAPFVKSVLFYGPKGTGKSMAMNAIANECGAFIFNLSYSNICTRVNEKDLKMLIHITLKVARAYEPSIIYIDEPEGIFKKPKKGAKFGPQNIPADQILLKSPLKMKKEFIRQFRQIRPPARMILIGEIRNPIGLPKPLLSFFDRHFFFSFPRYSSRYVLWSKLISAAKVSIPDTFDLSTLTRITQGFTAGTIQAVVENTLKTGRLQTLSKKPLTVSEFLDPLSKYLPVMKEEFDEWMKLQSQIEQGHKGMPEQVQTVTKKKR